MRPNPEAARVDREPAGHRDPHRGEQRSKSQKQQEPRQERACRPQLQQHTNGRHSVAPTNLLAGGTRPRRERHWPFVDPVAGPEQPRRDLGLDVEPVSGELEPADDVGAHDLVTGLHVGDGGAEHEVRERGQDTVRRDGRPWCGGPRREETRSVHDVARPVQDRSDERRELGRIELQVRILYGQHGASCPRESLPDGVSLAVVAAGVNDGHEWQFRQRVEDGAGAVARTVVNDDDLARSGKVNRKQARDHGRDRRLLVEDRNDDRDERRTVVARGGHSWKTSFPRRP
ncbi:MAG: hypothetical protein V7647_3133 [Acidobacteriota bacterium]